MLLIFPLPQPNFSSCYRFHSDHLILAQKITKPFLLIKYVNMDDKSSSFALLLSSTLQLADLLLQGNSSFLLEQENSSQTLCYSNRLHCLSQLFIMFHEHIIQHLKYNVSIKQRHLALHILSQQDIRLKKNGDSYLH